MTTTQNLTTTNRFHASAPATCACSPRLKNTTIMMPMADTDVIYHDNEDDHDDAEAEGDNRALTFNRYHRFRHVPADCMPRLSCFRYVPYHPTSSPFTAIKCCAE